MHRATLTDSLMINRVREASGGSQHAPRHAYVLQVAKKGDIDMVTKGLCFLSFTFKNVIAQDQPDLYRI